MRRMQSLSQRTQLAPALSGISKRQGGLFTTAQARAAGYTKGEIEAAVRSGSWVRLQHGVLTTSARLARLSPRSTHVARLRAVLLRTTQPTFASHLSGAILRGLPLLGGVPELVSVTQHGPARSRVQGGARVYTGRVEPEERDVVHGIGCLTLARTVADVARSSRFDQAVVVADAALRNGLPAAELRAMARSCAGWPGARQLARVVAFARADSESPGESMSRMAFASCGLPEPRLQVNIYDDDGFVGRVDFLWDQYMTIAEFDGRVKYASGDPAVLYEEKRREDRLRAAGYEVVRFSWADLVRRPEWVAAKLQAAFDRQARRARLAAGR